ncbi:MAG: hypothetical protein KIT87_17860 [Anaerolineae bacterium]|nr:hypothetical protein [Anaerolineae bacterium]
MPSSDDLYERITARLGQYPLVTRRKIFGVPAVCVHGNSFLAYHQGEMAFKLRGEDHARALAVPDARLWDPSGAGRPMREWVHLPASQSDHWDDFADLAYEYVATLPPK